MKRSFVWLLWAVLPAIASAEEWSKSYTITGLPRLTVQSDDADVRIRPCDCKQIAARVVWEGYKADRVKITENQSGDSVMIGVRTKNQHFNINFGNKWIHIELTVPRQAYVDAQTGDGHIDVDGIKGELRVSTGDGGIDIDGVDGLLRARSGDGHIRATGRFDELNLHTGDGHIEARVQPGSVIKSDWDLHSGDGRINLRLPQDFSANLYAKTGDGRIHSDLPLTVTGDVKPGNELRGKLNAGGGSLNIQTGDGSIYLDRL